MLNEVAKPLIFWCFPNHSVTDTSRKYPHLQNPLLPVCRTLVHNGHGEKSLEIKGNRRCAALCYSLVNGLNIIPIGVEYEGSVISRMVGPHARWAIVVPSVRQRSVVEGINRRAIFRLKSQMMPPSQLARAVTLFEEDTTSSSATK